MFDDLFSPLTFTIVKLKRRLAITKSVSYDLGSYSFTPVIAIPNILKHVIQIFKMSKSNLESNS